MNKKQLLTIAVAATMIGAVCIGVWWFYGSEEGYDPGEGVLLSSGEYDVEYMTLGKRGLTIAEAHEIAMEKLEASDGDTLGSDETYWETLWTISKGVKGWSENTGNWNELMVADFEYVSFSKENEKPIYLEDESGELMFSLMGPKKGIVVMSSTIKDIVVALGKEGNITGADNWSIAELSDPSKVTNVGGYQAANFSTIVRTNPDLVIVDRSWTEDSLQKQLRDAGIPVVGINSRGSLEDIKDNMMIVGYTTGSAAAAKDIVDWMTHVEEEMLKLKLTGGPGVMMSMGIYGTEDPFLYGTGNPQSDMMTAVGGINVISDTGYMRKDKGDILGNFNDATDIIIEIGMGTMVGSFKDDIVLKEMDAVKDNKIYSISGSASNAMNRSGPDIIYSLAMFYVLLTNDDPTFTGFDNDYKTVLENHAVVGPILKPAGP